MTNPIEPAGGPVSWRRLPALAARPGRSLVRGLASIAVWARLTGGSLRFGEADARLAFDPDVRSLLWQVLVETIAAIGALAPPGVSAPAGLAGLARLGDRVRERVAAGPPRLGPPDGTEPPHVFVLEMLGHDVQPCLSRWQPRLEEWQAAECREADWPLLELCRSDLARTRERLVERAWQLGIALKVPGLGRLLPGRPAMAPELIAADELAAAEQRPASPDRASAEAGWRIYVEAVARLPARDPPTGPGMLGETISALDTLAGELRAGLQAMPPPRPNGAPDTIQALAFALLTEGVQPFLAEWRLRYRKFAASQRPESRWGRAEECRAALAVTRARCLPKIEALGRKVGATPSPAPADPGAASESAAPLQLPPPETRS